MTCKQRTKTCMKRGCGNSFTERVKESNSKWQSHNYCSLSCGRSTKKGKKKVCNDKKCMYKGVPQQMRNFAKDRNTKDGYKRKCYSCWKRNYELSKKDSDRVWRPCKDAKIGSFAGFLADRHAERKANPS